MKNILFLTINTLRVTFKKKGNIIVYLLLPVIGVLLSVGIYSSVSSGIIDIGYIDNDKSFVSSEIIESISNLNGYKVSDVSKKDVNELLLSGKLTAYFIVPEGFEESILNQNTKKTDIISIKGYDTTVWIENYINLNTRNMLDLSVASDGNLDSFKTVYNSYIKNKLKVSEIKLEDEQTGKLMTVTSTGFLIMFIMLGAGITSQFILNDKRNRTYYRICSSPVSSFEYLFSNVLTSFIIEVLQIILVLLSFEYIFNIETFVPAFYMFLILAFFALVSTGLSLMITAYSGSSYMASTLNTLILTPTCMLGGCFWPIDLMPGFMQKISYSVPQRWVISSIEKIQHGYSLSSTIINFIMLLLFAIVFYVVAIIGFKSKKNVRKFI